MMHAREQFRDELERAEEFARIIERAKDGKFPLVGGGGRGIIQVFMMELEKRDAKIAELEKELRAIKSSIHINTDPSQS